MKTHILCLIALCYASNYSMEKGARLPAPEPVTCVIETTALLHTIRTETTRRGEKLTVLEGQTSHLEGQASAFSANVQAIIDELRKQQREKLEKAERRKNTCCGRFLNWWEKF